MTIVGGVGQVLILLAAAILSVGLLQRLRVSPIIAYLLAGIVVGPQGLALVEDSEATHLVAELGVIFLLFTLGLHLPLHRLRAMRRLIFGLGAAQVVVTAAAIAVVAALLGRPVESAILLGGALALSSTATVLQILAARGESATGHGRAAIGVLLFQDLAVVPLLALLPLLAGREGSVLGALGLAAVKAAVALGIIVGIGRLVLPHVYRRIAAVRTPEVFAALNLLLVLGTGWITAQAGMSMALGAFLAGLLLAGTVFRHQVEADIEPFRGLFLGLFFLTVGMGLDVGLLARQAGLVALLLAALLTLKAGLVALLARAFGESVGRALRLGLVLAQGGEFAFVLLGAAMAEGLVASEIGQPLLVVVAVSIALTPLLAELGRRIESALEPARPPVDPGLATAGAEAEGHVLLAGFGRVGHTVFRMLTAQGVAVLAVEADVHRVNAAREKGLPVHYGDGSRIEIWRAGGLDRARALVVTLDDVAAVRRIVSLARAERPDLPIIVRSRDARHRRELREAGATLVVLETVEASLQLGAAALEAAGLGPETIGQVLDAYRADDYAAAAETEPGPART